MTGPGSDSALGAQFNELHAAIVDALPENAELQFDLAGALALDVQAWWTVCMQDGVKQVDSLSFQLTPSMVQTYLKLPPSDRAEVCARLKNWVAWALDGGPPMEGETTGFDISIAVPLNIFWPSDASTGQPVGR